MIPILFAISICWDLHTDPNVTSYRVFRDGVFVSSVTTNRVTIEELESNKVYGFTVTAVSNNGLESLPSEELRYVVPHLNLITTPMLVTFLVSSKPANVDYILESTDDFKNWREENYITVGENATHVINTLEPMRFFRVRLNIKREGCAQ